MPHASWKAILRLSLVSVPVQAYNAAGTEKGAVQFNQLHDKCKNRIKYVKTCPVHGEIPNNEIVKGFEYAKDEYVVMEDGELESLRGKDEKAVDIDAFVKPDAIDPKYFEGRTFYLMPDGPMARKPYAVLLQVLHDKKLWGLAIANFSSRDHLVVLRAADEVLCVETLHYAAELRGPAELWGRLDLPKVEREEARLASMLIDASTAKSVDLTRYRDTYNEQVRDLVEAKVEGREIVTAPEPAQPPVLNLMEALKKSLSSKDKVTSAKRVAADSLRRAGKAPRKAGRRKSAG
ncbi:MAG: Ku protein [Pirellulales bacterium]